MDCKHEEVGTAADYYATWPKCKGCNKDLNWDDVVILTKPQHQLMQDVIDAVGAVKRNAVTFDDGGYTTYAVEQAPMRNLISRLDNLEGEK